ncbi:MAG: hypothetical protein ATN32_07675 [Candidatus Epulonipiscium fishelsonii]|nr:MAG: hypothetical protein ATN32_07675 [Epulopiscium sp. AS2M-Bin002]
MKTIKIAYKSFYPKLNKKLIEESIIIKILQKHYNVEFSACPDYIFYSRVNECIGFNNGIRIYFESEHINPDFNLCDYTIGYEDIELNDRYIRSPYYARFYQTDYEKAKNKHKVDKNILNTKTKFCNFIYSNGWGANPWRKEMFDLINIYKKVDSGGRYLNNIGEPVKDKYEFQLSYKFSIACENISMPGYVTEKIVQAFAAKTIPIYWGDPHIIREFNPKAFINCNEYTSFDEVMEKIIEIDNNDDLFLEMLQQPIHTDEQIKNNRYTENLEKFLVNIMEQPIKKAYRRSPSLDNKKYEENLKKLMFHSNNFDIIPSGEESYFVYYYVAKINLSLFKIEEAIADLIEGLKLNKFFNKSIILLLNILVENAVSDFEINELLKEIYNFESKIDAEFLEEMKTKLEGIRDEENKN